MEKYENRTQIDITYAHNMEQEKYGDIFCRNRNKE